MNRQIISRESLGGQAPIALIVKSSVGVRYKKTEERSPLRPGEGILTLKQRAKFRVR